MSVMNVKDFMNYFNFKKERSLFVGVERESFIRTSDWQFATGEDTQRLLKYLGDDMRFGYEFPACQLEDRVGPLKLHEVEMALTTNDNKINHALEILGLLRSRYEVEEKVPLEIFPDPTGRYQKIAERLSDNILRSAFSVIGTHVHIGMPDHETALMVYNQVTEYVNELCSLGDNSNGRRLEHYKKVATNFYPPKYRNWDHFFGTACDKGFATNPRNCWSIIRISAHGTIEFRMFGATEDTGKTMSWIKICHDICKKAMHT